MTKEIALSLPSRINDLALLGQRSPLSAPPLPSLGVNLYWPKLLSYLSCALKQDVRLLLATQKRPRLSSSCGFFLPISTGMLLKLQVSLRARRGQGYLGAITIRGNIWILTSSLKFQLRQCFFFSYFPWTTY